MSHGGKRQGAGRKPKNALRYGDSHTRIYVPIGMEEEVKRFTAGNGFKIPLYESRVQAGLPESAGDRVDDNVDLLNYLVKDPKNTFLVRVAGDSMKDANINEGDLLVVDRQMKPSHMKIVIASIDGQLTVKFLGIRGGKAYLMPANPRYKEIPVDEENGITIWGVVLHSVQSF